jgi:HD superfamily phosphodiesterase
MDILKNAELFARKEYAKHDLVHGWKHIEDVMKYTLELAKQIDRSIEFENIEVDHELLQLAVLFHDISYKSYETHVEESVKVAEDFLKKQNFPKEKIAKLKEIMLAHSGPHRRKFGDAKLIEGRILYDADKAAYASKSLESYRKYYPTFYFDFTRKLIKRPEK